MVEGKVCIIKNGNVCVDFNEGDIFVFIVIDVEMNNYIEKVGVVVIENGGMILYIVIVGINLDILVIVFVIDIINLVKDGEVVIVDVLRGVVYRGLIRVL